jgi:AraC family transcriptional regulator
MDNREAQIEVKDIPEMHVAYLRHHGPYAGDSELFGRMFQKLFGWAGPRGLVGGDTKVLSIYEEDPATIDEQGLRMDVAISVPAGAAAEGEISTRTLPAGRYAVGHFEITADQYREAWVTMMNRSLPEAGYKPSAGPCLEMYLNDPGHDPKAMHIVDIYIPVEPL